MQMQETLNKKSTVTPIEAALDIEAAEQLAWDDSADVLVVGWGAAGACAALEAKASGADVLVIDRFSGGGASVLSGGVVYAGGGTRYQREAGFQDSPELMAAYLQHEVNGVVSDALVERFAHNSVHDLTWLEQQGVRFNAAMPPMKTSYPPDGCYLYYSGNELVPAYRVPGQCGKPAPRGHRAVAKGQSGATLYGALHKSTLAHGVRTLTQASVRRLVRETRTGRIVGVEVWALPQDHALTQRHKELDGLIAKWRLYQAGKAHKARLESAQIERQIGQRRLIRARQGVVLSTGGYIYNHELVQRHAPAYQQGWPIGGAGCDGSGLRLGQSVGAAVKDLDNISAWRFITPPSVWPKGLVVNAHGARFCNEQVYGAKLGYDMVEHQGGKAWLILDGTLRRKALWECLFGGLWAFQSLPALMLMFKSARKGKNLSDLAAQLGMDAAVLQQQFVLANAAARGEAPDPMGKSEDMRHVFSNGPFYALDISITQKMFPLAVLSLGGLVLNEDSGAVLDAQGRDIPGLFAAGRTAIGLASSRYVSGLSLADCVFSGRRAGRAAAAVATAKTDTTADTAVDTAPPTATVSSTC